MNKPAYQVVFKKSAVKEFNALPANIRQRVLDAIHLLSINPHTELLQIKNRFPRLHATGADSQLDEIQQWLHRVEDHGFSPICA